MVIQLVPSDCSIANLPNVAARIAVPAVFDPSGMTLADALVTLLAVIVLRYRTRPGKLAGAGNVTVQLVVVKRSEPSVAATV